jgi:Asp-tRNA(Asn)/Glu-tRNA(Gln) amidotransferase A subunit family amidase
VAAGFFPLAYGTQTAGSVIRPAAYCGVVGYKPTFGTISRFGMKVMSDSLDTVGVLARSVADCALLAGAVSGHDLGDPEVRPDAAPRVGLCRSPSWHLAGPETAALLERVGAALLRAGAAVCDRQLPEAFSALVRAHPIVMNSESGRALGWELATARDGISPGLRERLEFGLGCSEAERMEALGVFESTQRAFPAALDGLDVLVTPSAPGEAPAGLDWTGDPAFNFIWTSLHVPCVTVPAGTGPNGLPLGIQIVGRQGDDRAVLAWAQWVASAIS